MDTRSTFARAAGATAAFALLAALAGCGDRVEGTQMPQPQRPNVEINRQGMEGAGGPRDGAGVQNKGAQVDKGAQRDRGARDGYVGSLGAKGGTSVLDPDRLIAEQVKAALASSPAFAAAEPPQVRSRDGEVTLLGRAPDAQARERATQIALSVPKVRAVDNRLVPG